MAGGALLVTAALALLPVPANAATTQEVEFTARYAKGARNDERGGGECRPWGVGCIDERSDEVVFHVGLAFLVLRS